MGLISTIDLQTRMDIVELLSRYCHYIDHDDGEAWAGLFTADGIFEHVGVVRLVGREQLRAVPGFIQEKGRGRWRHQVTNIIVDQACFRKEMTVRAYGLVTDWNRGGELVNFCDYTIGLRQACRWQIVNLKADMLADVPVMA